MYSLGLEFSTQSVKIVLLNIETGTVEHTAAIGYDAAFPSYRTEGGVLPSADPAVRHSSPFMLIESIDAAFRSMREHNLELSMITAIKADAMQHCTVYADATFKKRLSGLDPESPLLPQLGPSLTRGTSPIWEDRSTEKEVSLLESLSAPMGGMSSITGNNAELRFPAAQIMKWAEEEPVRYDRTAHVFLLSAFITSVLAGTIAPVDTGDGWGSNLNNLDINKPGWSMDLAGAIDARLRGCGVTTPLRDKLGGMCRYDDLVGTVGPYFHRRYGINREAVVLAGTGDNPATLLGCGGGVVVSLGSSYTVNGVMERIAPSRDGEYNVFGFTPGRAMALSVQTNGSKLHDHFLKTHLGDAEWGDYARVAGGPELSENEPLMLPYLYDESVPLHKAGIIRDGFTKDDSRLNIRALHLSQALSLRLHSDHLGEVRELCIVGGASRNLLLRQWISDVFGVRTFCIRDSDFAAPLGCAISGARHVLGCTYEEAAGRYVRIDNESRIEPIHGNLKIAASLLHRYRELEKGAGERSRRPNR